MSAEETRLRSALIRLAHANPGPVRQAVLPLVMASRTSSKRAAGTPLAGTVEMFLVLASSKLTQYDKKLQVKQPNLYRLGHYLEALNKVRKAMTPLLNDASPDALEKLKSAFLKFFTSTGKTPDLAPIKAVFKQIDDFIATGRPPSLVR
jgi:hypothetical protein